MYRIYAKIELASKDERQRWIDFARSQGCTLMGMIRKLMHREMEKAKNKAA